MRHMSGCSVAPYPLQTVAGTLSWRAHRGTVIAWVCLALLLLIPRAALALPPEHLVTRNLGMDMRTGTIVVQVGVTVNKEAGLYDMLKDGASIQLTATLKLERIRTFLTNILLAEQTYTSILRHNPLTREFLLYMPGEVKPVADRDLSRLLAATWYKLSFLVGSVDLLRQAKPDSDYRISLNLTLQHTEVPPWLARAFVFWSKDVVDSVTRTIPFSF